MNYELVKVIPLLVSDLFIAIKFEYKQTISSGDIDLIKLFMHSFLPYTIHSAPNTSILTYYQASHG